MHFLYPATCVLCLIASAHAQVVVIETVLGSSGVAVSMPDGPSDGTAVFAPYDPVVSPIDGSIYFIEYIPDYRSTVRRWLGGSLATIQVPQTTGDLQHLALDREDGTLYVSIESGFVGMGIARIRPDGSAEAFPIGIRPNQIAVDPNDRNSLLVCTIACCPGIPRVERLTLGESSVQSSVVKVEAAWGVAVDPAEPQATYSFSADFSSIVKQTPTSIQVIAGTPGKPGFSGDGGPAALAQIDAHYSHGLVITPYGVCFTEITRIRCIDREGGNITTVYTTEVAAINGISVDPFDGSLIVGDSGKNRILRVRVSRSKPDDDGCKTSGKSGDVRQDCNAKKANEARKASRGRKLL